MKEEESKHGFKYGDRVQFDLTGSKRSPFGFGYISYADKNTFRVSPEHPLGPGAVITNVKKVGSK